jgi:hypothetical protein
MLQYNYTYGNEDILSGEITVHKHESFYTVTFVQESFDIDSFEDITVGEGIELLSRSVVTEQQAQDLLPIVRTIILKLVSKCNPSPETLFKILE